MFLSRWPRTRRVVRSLGVVLFAAWVVGAVPFYAMTPAGAPLQMLLGWTAPTPAAEPDGDVVADDVSPVDQPTAEATPVAVALVDTPAPTPTLAAVKGPGSEAESVVDASATQVPVPEDAAASERFAFLLMGYGGGGHEGGYLSDSMLVAIVDPGKKTLALLSIPRDAWLPMSLDGKTTFYNKANTAYAFGRDTVNFPNSERQARYKGERGAGAFASDTVSRVLGIPVRYYLALDFAGFRQGIDAVGGIDVDVPQAFAARYPANDDPSIDPTWTIVRFRAGTQHMTGERAIQYARAREAIDDSGEGSDFARSRRQRLIIEAFKTRLFQPGGLIQIPRLLTIAAGHVDTNYDLPGAAQIGQLLLDWQSVRFHQTALTLGNFLDEATGPGGAYVLVPSMDGRSWRQVRAFARRLWDDPESAVAAAQTPLQVVNASGTSGIGGRVSEALLRLGYLVRPPTTGPARLTTRLLDGTRGKAEGLVRRLAKDLGTELPAEAASANADGLVLEIGSADPDLGALASPGDDLAPSSIAGILKFGAWMPEPEPTEQPHPTAVGSPQPVASGTAHPVGSGTPATAGTGTPGPRGTGTPLGTPRPGASGTAAPGATGPAGTPPTSGAAPPSGTLVPGAAGAGSGTTVPGGAGAGSATVVPAGTGAPPGAGATVAAGVGGAPPAPGAVSPPVSGGMSPTAARPAPTHTSAPAAPAQPSRAAAVGAAEEFVEPLPTPTPARPAQATRAAPTATPRPARPITEFGAPGR